MMTNKSLTLALVCFIMFGMLFGSVGVIADSDDEGSGSSDDSSSDSSNDDSSDDSNDDSSGSSDDSDDDDVVGRVRTREFVRTIDADGRERRVRIEREVEIDADGRKVVKIKRRVRVNGDEIETEIRIMTREDDGGFKKVIRVERKIDGEIFEVETRLELEDRFEGNESELRARLSNGKFGTIKVMPDRASAIAIEKLRTRNFTIELKETLHNNVPRVVYNIKANKNGRFLGIFKMRLRIEGEIDPETGEFLGVSKPWWAFLVSEPDDDFLEPPVNNDTNQTIPIVNDTVPPVNDTNDTVPPVNDTNQTNDSIGV